MRANWSYQPDIDGNAEDGLKLREVLAASDLSDMRWSLEPYIYLLKHRC